MLGGCTSRCRPASGEVAGWPLDSRVEESGRATSIEASAVLMRVGNSGSLPGSLLPRRPARPRTNDWEKSGKWAPRANGGSSPGHACAFGTEVSRWQGNFLTPGSPFSSGEGAWPKPTSGDDCQALDQRGRGDEAVEWVFVVQRQRGQRLDMGYLNGKKLDAVKGELRGKHDRERFIEPELVELHLDRDFLQADGGEEPGIGRVFDRRPGRCAQPGVGGEEPEKGVGVEQKLHSMYSRNSSSGSSKSSDIQILPLRLPALG